MDDYLMVQETDFYSKIENVPASFSRSVWRPTGDEYNYYRPASTSLYIVGAWLSTMISGHIDPWIFHLTNMLLQVVVVLLLFALLKEFGASPKAAAAAAGLLALHPASAGTLGWIPGQNELLLAVAVIGGFLSFIRALRHWPWFIAHGFFIMLGLLTKENAVGLPILCIMYLCTTPKRKQASAWASAWFTWVFCATLFVSMASQGGGGGGPSISDSFNSMFAGIPYLLIYLGQLILPISLSTLPTPQDTPIHIWVAGVHGAVALLVAVAWKIRSRPVVLIGAAWFVGFLWPTFANMLVEMKSTFILRTDRSYLASAGLLIVALQIQIPALQAAWRKRAFKAGVGALVLVLLTLNLQHQLRFSTGMRYYLSGIEGSPRSAFAHAHLGDMYLAAKRMPEAIKQYQEALKLNPYEPQAHNNLGVVYMRMGDMDKAMLEYQEELKFNPTNLLTWSNLGSIFLRKGNHDQAEFHFRKAVDLNPAYRDAWAGLYQIYDFKKQPDKKAEALRNLQKSEMDMRRGI